MNVPSDPGDAPSVRATCAVVGTVSPTRLFLEPHGNFNPMFENSALETSKAQFQLVSPVDHTDFGEDFKHGVERIERLQGKAVTEGPHAEHFVVVEGHTKGLRFSSPLFEKRVRILIYSIFTFELRLAARIDLQMCRPFNMTVRSFLIQF